VRLVPGEGVGFWQRAEALVLEALRDYARHAANGGRLQRQLFAEDAEQGFAFIDICQKRFDVVLMNPPFGDPVVSVKAWTQETYPSCRNDIYGAFVLRGAALVNPEGRLGAITNRTGLFLGGYAEWRKQCVYGVLSHLLILCDLGSGVLDSALVE